MNTRRRGNDRMAVVRVGIAVDTDRFSGFGGDLTAIEAETCVPFVCGPVPTGARSVSEDADFDTQALGHSVGGLIARIAVNVARDACGLPEIFLRALREQVFDCIEDELLHLETRGVIEDEDEDEDDGDCFSGVGEG